MCEHLLHSNGLQLSALTDVYPTSSQLFNIKQKRVKFTLIPAVDRLGQVMIFLGRIIFTISINSATPDVSV
jgi:hypothetical protein